MRDELEQAVADAGDLQDLLQQAEAQRSADAVRCCPCSPDQSSSSFARDRPSVTPAVLSGYECDLRPQRTPYSTNTLFLVCMLFISISRMTHSPDSGRTMQRIICLEHCRASGLMIDTMLWSRPGAGID